MLGHAPLVEGCGADPEYPACQASGVIEPQPLRTCPSAAGVGLGVLQLLLGMGMWFGRCLTLQRGGSDRKARVRWPYIMTT